MTRVWMGHDGTMHAQQCGARACLPRASSPLLQGTSSSRHLYFKASLLQDISSSRHLFLKASFPAHLIHARHALTCAEVSSLVPTSSVSHARLTAEDAPSDSAEKLRRAELVASAATRPPCCSLACTLASAAASALACELTCAPACSPACPLACAPRRL